MEFPHGMVTMITIGLNRMDKIFFNYYLFYNKILNDDTPIVTAIFSMSASIGFILVNSINFVLVYSSLEILSKNQILIFMGIVISINFIIYYFRGRGKLIIEKNYINSDNRKREKILVFLFFLISVGFIIGGPILTRYFMGEL